MHAYDIFKRTDDDASNTKLGGETIRNGTRGSAARHNTAWPCVKSTETQHVPQWLINKRPLYNQESSQGEQTKYTHPACWRGAVLTDWPTFTQSP